MRADNASQNKMHTKIIFNDLMDFMGIKYRLSSVIGNIANTVRSGHYICYVRGSPKGWTQCNDSKMIPVAAHKVFSTDSYKNVTMLFYERVRNSGVEKYHYHLVWVT